MPCLTKLLETSGSPAAHVSLTAATIELVAADQASLTHLSNVETNKPLTAGGFGALLQFNTASITYQVAIVDTAKIYGGVTIANLSGTTSGDLDVVLEKLPTTPGPGGAATGATASQVRQLIRAHVMWTPTERQAVLRVIDALTSLRGTTSVPLLVFVSIYEMILRDCNVDPTVF